MSTTNVLVVDDLDLVAKGISTILSGSEDINVIGEAKSGKEAINLTEKLAPDVILLDLRMPDLDGLAVTKKILSKNKSAKILILTAHIDDAYPSRLLKAGAAGYITKDSGAEELIHAIQEVHKGRRYISLNIAQKVLLKGLDNIDDDPFKQLSNRELQVTSLIAQGYRAPEIAEKMELNGKTINSFRYRIFDKLQIEGDVELALLAIRHGLVKVA